MQLVQSLQQAMTSAGASWVMWLLIALSFVSVTIIVERAWFYWRVSGDVSLLAHELRGALQQDGPGGALERLSGSRSAEAAVVCAGLAEASQGAPAAERAMKGAKALQRIALERRLAFLGTLGNNAPFVGLFGTVIGIVQAFDALGQTPGGGSGALAAPESVMSAIAEALVATALGLAVAIPAVATYNYFQRRSRAILARTEALSEVLLGHLERKPRRSAAEGAE